MAHKVDESSCIGCGACAGVCPVSAITVDATASVDADTCIDCATCEGACPTGAIAAE